MSGFYVTKDDINSKSQFVAALRKFLKTGKTTVPPDNGREYHLGPGELLLIEAITDYFDAHTEIPDVNGGIGFFSDLHKHLADAFHEFRTHGKHEQLRSMYWSETESSEIPDLFDIRHRARTRVLFDLDRFLPLIAGRMDPGVGQRVESYFNCQRYLVEATWRVFVRSCYRSIAPVIKASRSRSHRGLFGRTTLSVDVMAGVQYTFERPTSLPDHRTLFERITAIADTPGARPEDKYAAIEVLLMTRKPAKPTRDAHEISFAVDESDMVGCRAGMNRPGSAISNYKICVEMIEDVVAHWDPERLIEVDE